MFFVSVRETPMQVTMLRSCEKFMSGWPVYVLLAVLAVTVGILNLLVDPQMCLTQPCLPETTLVESSPVDGGRQ